MSVDFEISNLALPQVSSLVEVLKFRAKNQPEQIAYTFIQHGEEVEQINYFELEQKARAIAHHLQTCTSIGDRALLLYPSGLEYIAAFFGCLLAGVIAVPAYPPRPNQNLSRLLLMVCNAQAKVALTTQTILGSLETRWAENPVLASLNWLATDAIADSSGQNRELIDIKINSDTLAFLQYTSGSTGTPKGVMVSHGNLLHNLSAIYQGFTHHSQSQGVIWLPLYHDMGLIGGVLQPMYGGFPVVLMSPLDFLQKPLRWLQAISHYRGTTSGGPNFAYDLCLRRVTPEQRDSLDLSSWDLAFTGAEPVRAETLEAFTNYFGLCGFRRQAFYPCYGMAETTLMVTGGKKTQEPIVQQIERTALEKHQVRNSDNGTNSQTVVSCGQSLPDQKLLIVDPQTLTQCLPNQVGEIWVAGPSVTQGYWQHPEETQKTFHAYLADTREGPFLRTGDLGFLKEGELFVTGRLKDVIIIHGQNYYPQDIERVVENSHVALRPNSGAAFTTEIDGVERLIIVQEIERNYLRKLDLQEVVETIRQAVTAEYSIPVYVTVLVKTGSIPKTSSGKIQRHACRSELLKGSLNMLGDGSEDFQNATKFKLLSTQR